MTEFENSNSYRNYPFSGNGPVTDSNGSEFPSDVFVDAVVYAMNPSSAPELTSFDAASGSVTVSVGESELSGTESGGVIELFSDRGHAGTIACGPGFAREAAAARRFSFDGTAVFCSSCVVPVSFHGVRSVSAGGRTADGRVVSVTGSGRLYSTTDSDGPYCTFRFDVSRKRVSPSQSKDERPKLKRLIVAVSGKSVFDLHGVSPTEVLVTAGDMTREDVCYQAHLSDAVSVLADTCAGPQPMRCNPESMHDKSGDFTLGGCSVSLSSFDLLNYRNPVKISTVNGDFGANVPQVRDGMSEAQVDDEAGRMIQSPVGDGNGIVISIPGA